MKNCAKILFAFASFLALVSMGSLRCAAENGEPVAAGEEEILTHVTINEGTGRNDTISADYIHVSWERVEGEYEYSWCLDNGRWSEWSTDTSFSEVLDDGDHVAEVRVRETANQ